MSKKDAFHSHLQQELQGQRRKGRKSQGYWRGRPFRRLSKKLGRWRGGGLDWKEKRFCGKGESFRKPRKAECSFAYKMTGDLDRRRQGVLGM